MERWGSFQLGRTNWQVYPFGVALEVDLVLRFCFPERSHGRDFGDDCSGPQSRRDLRVMRLPGMTDPYEPTRLDRIYRVSTERTRSDRQQPGR